MLIVEDLNNKIYSWKITLISRIHPLPKLTHTRLTRKALRPLFAAETSFFPATAGNTRRHFPRNGIASTQRKRKRRRSICILTSTIKIEALISASQLFSYSARSSSSRLSISFASDPHPASRYGQSGEVFWRAPPSGRNMPGNDNLPRYLLPRRRGGTPRAHSEER